MSELYHVAAKIEGRWHIVSPSPLTKGQCSFFIRSRQDAGLKGDAYELMPATPEEIEAMKKKQKR